ncbi:Hypothetical_protein [Hexamita inflata]|uniref:Hypothetical_protein n=1 Tax=Hexamita inflata TaxID=28002 RepID=A0AA86UVJ5_9EUKA|nr:Hypothetical protein HINF_LOCUS21471 [Hexamita inflata]CAI9973525.1 Hypothetical protein HINF_LOCUS61170 [Hexamita inflata]
MYSCQQHSDAFPQLFENCRIYKKNQFLLFRHCARTQNQLVFSKQIQTGQTNYLQTTVTHCNTGGLSKYNPLQMNCKIKSRFVIDPKYLCKQPLQMNQFIVSDVVMCDTARYDEEIVEERSNSDYNPLQYMMIGQQ